MRRSNKLYYCTFFDNRNQQSVLDKEGLRLCLLISTDDFARILDLGITVIVSAQFHGDAFSHFDSSITYDNGLLIARANAKRLLATLSLT